MKRHLGSAGAVDENRLKRIDDHARLFRLGHVDPVALPIRAGERPSCAFGWAKNKHRFALAHGRMDIRHGVDDFGTGCVLQGGKDASKLLLGGMDVVLFPV